MSILPSLVSIDILPSIRSVQNQKNGQDKILTFSPRVDRIVFLFI